MIASAMPPMGRLTGGYMSALRVVGQRRQVILTVEAPSPGKVRGERTACLKSALVTCTAGKSFVNSPTNGPVTEATPNVAPKKPMYFGLSASGTVLTIKIIAPEVMPADPRPWIARPIMTAMEFGADPQIAEPSS